MKKIVHFISQYYWPERIGSAPYIADMAEWLSKRGFEVHVTTSRPHYPSRDAFPDYTSGALDEQTHNGVFVHRISKGRSGDQAWARILSDLGFARNVILRGFRHFRKADAVVTLVPSCVVLPVSLAYLAKRGISIAVTHDVESGLAETTGLAKSKLFINSLRLVERLTYATADVITVLSDGMAQALAKVGVRGEMKVISIWSLHNIPASPPPAREGISVMYSGNFGKKQGLEAIIDSAERLAAEGGIRFVLQGDGSERDKLVEMARGKHLSNLEFRDLAAPDQFMDSLAAADLHLVIQMPGTAPYVVPSKIISIMSAGRPMIVVTESDSPTATIISKSGAGLLVSPNDPMALSAAIKRLATDAELRLSLGDAARRFALANFRRDVVLQEFEALIFNGSRNGAYEKLTGNSSV